MVTETILIILSCATIFLILVDIGLTMQDKKLLNFLHERFYKEK